MVKVSGGGNAGPQNHIIATHAPAVHLQGQGQGQFRGYDSSSDTITTTESRTSSSEDEIVSQVSLHLGFNPCKCCVCEDCDLRNHCMAIGTIEMMLWVLFIAIVVAYGIISRGSDPVLYKDTMAEPIGFQRAMRHNFGPGVANESSIPGQFPGTDYDEDQDEDPFRGGPIGRRREEAEDREANANVTLDEILNYEVYLRQQIGDAVIFLKPNTARGQEHWRENFQTYLVAMSISFTCVVILSISSGGICFVGAYYRKTRSLLLHTLLASITSCAMLIVGVFLAFIECYFQVGVSILCAGMYVYFAVCSYGLVTVIRAGFYDGFVYEGVAYTYSTVLRANVQTFKGVDGHLDTKHPNEKRIVGANNY